MAVTLRVSASCVVATAALRPLILKGLSTDSRRATDILVCMACGLASPVRCAIHAIKFSASGAVDFALGNTFEVISMAQGSYSETLTTLYYCTAIYLRFKGSAGMALRIYSACNRRPNTRWRR